MRLVLKNTSALIGLRKNSVVRSEQAIEEEVLVIDFSQLWLAMKSRYRLILASTLSAAVLAGVGSYLFYQEKYESTGTLMLNPSEISKVVTDVNDTNNFLKENGPDSSPYKNQEELLKSRLIADRTFNLLHQRNIHLPVQRPNELQRNIIGAHNVKGTDFIEISAKSVSPILAQHIAQAYMDSYLSLMAEISNTPLQKKKDFFQGQVVEAELALKAINEQIRQYQEQYGIVDIAVESQDKVRALLALDSSAKDTAANLAQKRAEAERIRQQLKIKRNDLTAALHAVATGQDSTLISLEQNLQDSEKEYQVKALVYSSTNPEMQQLQEKIAVLKRQITDQQILNAGQTFTPKSLMIKDSVRTTLVSRLAQSEADISALQNKLATTRGQFWQMQHTLQSLPKQQLEYARLILDQKNKENVLIRLKEKLSETQIQKAASGQKLQVIDTPDRPHIPLFPSRLHILLLGALAGAALSTLSVLMHTAATHKGIRPEWLERIYGLPVLSMIPWLPEQQWQAFRRRGALEITASNIAPELVKSYQDLALNLKVQRNIKGKDTLVVSSLMKDAGKSIVLANLAFCLAQSGERVILVDANLRKPRLHDTFNHAIDYERGLPELINTISEALYRSDQINAQDLLPLAQRAAIPSEIHPQLHYLNAGVSLDNTFEFLNSKGFGALIQVLRSGYDWVLIDAPPFLQSPDAAILLGYTEALLLLAEAGADETQILAVQHKVERLNSSIIGIVLRKT
jgi:uncharacterized protein involved in exopolysaccharide biosynthesis/Mrp family chromosome partitioning ATPase